MPVTPDFRDFILEQLNRLTPTTARAMFGGIGLYAGGRIFALIDDDTLYFKVDDGNRPAFEAVGSAPFRPFGPDAKPMGYYEVPADAVEDPDALKPWLDGALAAAQSAAGRKKPRPGRTSPTPPEKGTLKVSATKTIVVPLPRLYDAWSSAATRRLWLHVAGISTRRAVPRKSMRLIWNDGSSNVLVEFSTLAGGRCVIRVEHDGIKYAAQAEEIRAIWAASLQRLKNRMER